MEPVNPVAVRTELLQPSITDTDGAGGIGLGAAVPLPSVLRQPFTVCAMVKVPAVVTVMDSVVSPVLQIKDPVKPVAVNTEFPQLLTTSTPGVATDEFNGAASPLPDTLVQSFTVCVTV